MSRRRWPWLVAALVYALFWLWYTPLGGPLTEAEIESFAAALARQGGDPQRIDMLRRFMVEDDGRHFLMVNLLDMAEAPPALPATGPEADAGALLDHYMEHMYPALLVRASHPVFAGRALFTALDVSGIDGAESWTRAAVVRYRSRRDMMEIATNPAFGDRHEYKLAALEKTVAFPVRPELHPGDPRLLLALALLALAGLVAALPGRRAPD